MTSNDFIYWLKGYIELSKCDGNISLSEEQVKCVEDHLELVLKKVTPLREKVDPNQLAFPDLENKARSFC